MEFAFPPSPVPTLLTREGEAYAVRRIFCVGRNYAEHAREMGHQPERGAPFYFTKSPAHLTQSTEIPFARATADYHHEIELAVLLGPDAAPWAHACALDMTRRDLQALAKDKRRPWDLGKDVEDSAIFGPVARGFMPGDQGISLSVNGQLRQRGRLSEMIHSVPEILADLGRFYRLGAGDVILTGTPAGVGAVASGDSLDGVIDGLPPLRVRFVPALPDEPDRSG